MQPALLTTDTLPTTNRDLALLAPCAACMRRQSRTMVVPPVRPLAHDPVAEVRAERRRQAGMFQGLLDSHVHLLGEGS